MTTLTAKTLYFHILHQFKRSREKNKPSSRIKHQCASQKHQNAQAIKIPTRQMRRLPMTKFGAKLDGKIARASSRWCRYILLNIYHFTYIFSHAHTDAHTHKHTCTISIQEEWRQPGRGAGLRGAKEVERGERKGFVRDLVHTQKKQNVRKNPDIHKSQEQIRAHRASSKDTRLILTK